MLGILVKNNLPTYSEVILGHFFLGDLIYLRFAEVVIVIQKENIKYLKIDLSTSTPLR